MTTPADEYLDPIAIQQMKKDNKELDEELMPPARHVNTANSHLTVNTDQLFQNGQAVLEPLERISSRSRLREEKSRLQDDLALLKAERAVSIIEKEALARKDGKSPNRIFKHKSNKSEQDFGIPAEPSREVFKPVEDPKSGIGKFFKSLHKSYWLLRYFFYIIPVASILLIPLLIGILLYPDPNSLSVGGVKLEWFAIWLEIVWLSLWAGRIIAKCIPWPLGVIASIFTNNNKKWRDMGKQLELPATMFFWLLAIEISFLPTMKNHTVDGDTATRHWQSVVNKIIISFFVFATLNLVEKIIMQLIAMHFHLRTYADRIEVNKFQIACLTKMYVYSKEKLDVPDTEFTEKSGGPSGARTPAQLMKDVQRNTVSVMKKVGNLTGRVAGDFTGRASATTVDQAHQVILEMLHSTESSQALARRMYRTFCKESSENIYADDLGVAFNSDEDAESAFAMFDKDINGDISMEELESVCVEIGRERKSISASLKDLDGVIDKLDGVFFFIVIVIAILVFISIISTSAAGVLTSAGSTVLALSWLFSVTAQEFLQSLIFVFVKHPFDVGDRVSIYGNTGSTLKGDDYFVKRISLLYTEFKKMEGHIVQAPNSYLNTLFILNQRRSGSLAEAVPITIRFGTTLEQITSLKDALLKFVRTEKREYQSNILTELREIVEARSIVLNVVFFYKSNWQNEGLRLQRRNKFICAMMIEMQNLGIEGPIPGQNPQFPYYTQFVSPPPEIRSTGPGGPDFPDAPMDMPTIPETPDTPWSGTGQPYSYQYPSSPGGFSGEASGGVSGQSKSGRRRGETLADMNRRMDFSLGIQALSSSDPTGDVYNYDDRKPAAKLSPLSVATSTRARSGSIGRSSSVSQNISGLALERMNTTESQMNRRGSHRNRFFRRVGRHHEEDIESGMANINESPNSLEAKLDPRSGVVSNSAWKISSELSRKSLEKGDSKDSPKYN